MDLSPPDWLIQRRGSLQRGTDHGTWFVLLGGEPHYRLNEVPALGKFGWAVRQTENGQQIPCLMVYDTAEAALRGGLEALGKELGWV